MSSQKIRIRLKGYDHEVVDQSSKLIVDTAQKTGARVSGPIPLPTERNLYTVIRSPLSTKKGRMPSFCETVYHLQRRNN